MEHISRYFHQWRYWTNRILRQKYSESINFKLVLFVWTQTFYLDKHYNYRLEKFTQKENLK